MTHSNDTVNDPALQCVGKRGYGSNVRLPLPALQPLPSRTQEVVHMIPTQDEARKVASSSFWATVLGVWLVMGVVAVTLALALGIWNLIGAF